MTLPDYIYSTYNTLLKDGWHMKDIDEMDMVGYLRVRAWDARRQHAKAQPVARRVYIDEVWPMEGT